MNRQEFDNLLERYLDNQCTEPERRYVESWYAATQKEAKELDNFQQARLRDKLWNSIVQHADTRKSTRWGYSNLRKVAATLIIIGSCIFAVTYYLRIYQDDLAVAVLPSAVELVTVSNTDTTVREVRLRDGSSVRLHPGSEIKYPNVFGQRREVYLTGEAFFNVKKDPGHPFLVHAGEVTTRVLGTSFRVQAYQEQKEIKVAVTSGRVSVTSKGTRSFFKLWMGKQEVVLTPNQQLIYNRNEKTSLKQLVENPRILVHDTSREMAYNDEPVTKLLTALEKMYGITIQYDEKVLANCKITTEMTDEGLFERMDVICHVLHGHYSVNGTVIVVESPGCSN